MQRFRGRITQTISVCLIVITWTNLELIRCDDDDGSETQAYDMYEIYVKMSWTGISDCTAPNDLACDVDFLRVLYESMPQEEQNKLNTWDFQNIVVQNGNTTIVNLCSWLGVDCVYIENDDEQIFQRVSAILMDQAADGLRIETSIPKEISQLRYLEILSFYNVGLNGMLPSELSVLTNLQVLELSGFGQGDLPKEYSELVSMTYFHIDYGYIGGTLPGDYSTWKNMHSFGLYYQDISGSLPPEYSVWTNVLDFNLGFNQMKGTLPPEYSEMLSVGNLAVFENQLSGPIPVEYSLIHGAAWLYPQSGGLCIQDEYLHLFTQDGVASDVWQLPRCEQ
eukprot:TRINITY_DN12343_c1_g1_i2.p2 TRINITY_DN12343_c1_g1~~TRINITY_DN12343_c1_g1_i2.p2  ORF type:complete len:375 (+),score=20.80 TRINITY_DN12343_c1_g1_i2:118-1125(+)